MGIVDVSLFFVVENIVRFLDRLELDLRILSFGFGDLIRVTGKSGLFIVSMRTIFASFVAVCLVTLRYAFRTSSLLESLEISRTSAHVD